MAIFKALFGEYLDCDTYLDTAVADIVSLTASRSDGTARLTIKPYRKIDENRIHEVEAIISKALGVKLGIVCDETRTGFTTAYMDMVIEILKDRLVVANGYFNSADYELSGNELRITLNKGGKDLLLSGGCDIEIQKIIRMIFGFECIVAFKEGEFDAETAVDTMQKKADEESRRAQNIPAPSAVSPSGKPREHVTVEGLPLYLETQKPFTAEMSERIILRLFRKSISKAEPSTCGARYSALTSAQQETAKTT